MGISLGKLGIVHSSGRAPRLVLDNTICGLNQRCRIPERTTLPSAKDILRSYPIRNEAGPHCGFSLDIKAAHKRMALRPSEQGLVGFSFNNVLYFYRVAPVFGLLVGPFWGLFASPVSFPDLGLPCCAALR